MRVLIGCEFSGIVREAFAARGHEAFSCDLLPTETPQSKERGWHIQGDVFQVLREISPIDLLIFHWPCTRLCLSGVRWLYGGKGTKRDQVRWSAMLTDAHAFKALLNANVPHICGENPIPHRYAKEIMGDYTQIIQPYEYGHGERKATCLWLKNLPLLQPSNIVEGRTPRVHYASPGPERWKERSRSRTMPGIAAAMAEQWGNPERRLPDLFDRTTAST